MRTILKILFFFCIFSSFAAEKGDSYTINFNNVPAVEYIRFASKICSINFLFNEAELGFNVSVISKDEITPKNVMATLIQILRIHGLSLLEQEGNLVIHKNPDVKQIAQIVTAQNQNGQSAPIVTRVFSIKNVKIESVAGIIRPMISTEALLEVLSENNQLIVTDTSANMQKISELLDIIDSPQNPLVIDTYKVKENDPEYLIPLANQIMTPLAEGNPFILVPQTLNGRIYIVSTPKLTEKALGVLASLDSPAKDEIKKNMKSGQVFIYRPIHMSKIELDRSLESIAQSLTQSGYSETGLIEIIGSRQWLKDTHSFLFAGPPESIVKLSEILAKIDNADSQNTEATFFTYKPKSSSTQELLEAMQEIAQNLKKSKLADPGLIETIESAKEVDANQSLMFSGDSSFFPKVKELLTSVDQPPSPGSLEKGKYFLYKLKNVSGAVIEEDLDKFVDKLKSQHVKNPELVKMLDNIKWIKETNSLLITGSPTALEEAKKIIADYDIARASDRGPSDNFFIYKPQFVSPSYIEKSLKDISASLQKAQLSDPSLLATIQSMKFIDSTQSLAFTGSETTIEKIKKLISTIDVPSAMPSKGGKGKPTYFLYQIKQAPYQQLTASIRSFANDLKNTSVDLSFIEALNSIKYKAETNSLLFTGAPEDLEKVKIIVERFDVPSLGELPAEGDSAFFVYRPKYLSGPALETVLKEFSDHLKTTGFANQGLFNTIQNMRRVEKNDSLIFSGDGKSLEEVKHLLATFDVLGKGENMELDTIQSIEEDTCFLVYKLQYHKGNEIQTALKQVAKELIKNESKTKQDLISAINSLQWIQITNSLLSTGNPNIMDKLKELIKSLDVPLKQVFIEILVVDTTLTNMLNFGLDWGSKLKYKDRFTAATSNSPYSSTGALDQFTTNLGSISETNTPTGSSVPFTDGFDLGIIGDIIMHKGKSFLSLGSFIQALQTDNESSVVMTPKILTQDGRTSTIFIGTNIPYLGSQTAIVGGATSSTTQNLEYRDVGLDLSITPVMGNSDIVTLDIDLKRSVVDSTASTTTLTGVTTAKTAMQTTVHIPNKNFLVLSGMVTETKTKRKEGLPCLGGLPWIGAAFSQNNNLEDKRNVVIFIRPHIINSYQDMVSLTESQEDYFREKTGSPVLEQEFDEAAEMIKSLGDE